MQVRAGHDRKTTQALGRKAGRVWFFFAGSDPWRDCGEDLKTARRFDVHVIIRHVSHHRIADT